MNNAPRTTDDHYNEFSKVHKSQLVDLLQIPEPLIHGLYQQLQCMFEFDHSQNESDSSVLDYNRMHAMESYQNHFQLLYDRNLRDSSEIQEVYGAILVVPHIITFDMHQQNAYIDSLQKVDQPTLQRIYHGFQQLVTYNSNRINENTHTAIEQTVNTSTVHINKNCDDNPQLNQLVNAIADHPMLWSRIILHRSSSSSSSSIYGTIVAPPYLPHVTVKTDIEIDQEEEEADCTGPFPFQYHIDMVRNNESVSRNSARIIDVSLLYISSEGIQKMRSNSSTISTEIETAPTHKKTQIHQRYLPTIDLVPKYQYPNRTEQRLVRYTALLYMSNELCCNSSNSNHNKIINYMKEQYANFVHDMHVVRQEILQKQQKQLELVYDYCRMDDTGSTIVDQIEHDSNVVYRVYTDTDDPMMLCDPIVGLEANSVHFVMVSNIHDADIIYSYQSLFSPNFIHYSYIQQQIQHNKDHNTKKFYINQYPYEGAFVQKDHLARGLLQQHGLPRPAWSIETYDLDVQLKEFVGSVVLEMDTNENSSSIDDSNNDSISSSSAQHDPPLWIVKPASGTQSQGHVVTRSLAHILRLNDAVGGHRVVQRYIQRPVCLMKHKVDCRIIVLISSMGKVDENQQIVQLPIIHMHNACYFRIANKTHCTTTPTDRVDHESVLTATHLLHTRTSTNELRKLPFYTDTIQQLENEYPDGIFDWTNKILPQIKTMICDLFNGMVNAYPKMIPYSNVSKAVYGVDVMFQIDDNNEPDDVDDGTTISSNHNNVSITPKLTEVTFCPANNAICDAYVRNEELYRSYNKEIFECLFCNILSSNITRIQ